MEKITGRTTEKLGGMPVIQSFYSREDEKQEFFQGIGIRGYRLRNVKSNALATGAIGFLTSIHR